MNREARQRFFLRMTTIMTVTACYSVLVAGSMTAMNMTRLLTVWGDDIQITAYLNSDITTGQLTQLEKEIKDDTRVGRVSFVSREKALKDFQTQMASYAPDLAGDEDLLTLIPSSFQISLDGAVPAAKQVENIQAVAETLKTKAGIEEVRYGQEWVKKYATVVSAARNGTSLLAVILALASLLVISNSIRASVESRRAEIEVMELVGASSWKIRSPFLKEGAVVGGAAAILSLILCMFLLSIVKGHLSQELQFLQLGEHLSFLPVAWSFAVLFFGTGLGALASFLCVRQINDGWAARGGAG